MKRIRTVLTTLIFAALAVSLDAQTLRLADNLPDRKNGVGGIIEQLNTEFKAANPGVNLAAESYPDQPFQQKIKIYSAANQLPDVIKWWTNPSQFDPMVENQLALELNRADFEKYGFLGGALEAASVGGKLYGIPMTVGYIGMLYNKKLFADIGVTSPPTTLEALRALTPQFKAKGIIPLVVNGKDAWPLNFLYDQIVLRLSGDPKLTENAVARKVRYASTPVLVEAARILQSMIKDGMFQPDLMLSDYGAARNLFGQGKAAMYFMGTWEMGLAGDTSFSQGFRDNVDVMKFPAIKGGKGDINGLIGGFSDPYMISATTKDKALAVKYLQFLSEKFSVLAWEKQVGIPSRPVDASKAGALVQHWLQIAKEGVLASRSTTVDFSTAQFKNDAENAFRDLGSLLVTPEEFARKLDMAADKAAQKK